MGGANQLVKHINQSGTAFVTQAGTSSLEPEAAFGQNWESVRTFGLTRRLNAPLKVYVDTHGNGLYKAQYRGYVEQSLRSWSQALNGRLSYTYTNNPQAADITVGWVSSFPGDPYVAGVTNYWVGHADVQIKTIGVPEKDIKANIIHEFGHALGIAGHSPNQQDIMVATRRWHRGNTNYEPRLSRNDVQAIRRLYSLSWQRGEDLYSASAQSASLPESANETVAVNPDANASPEPLQPMDDVSLTGR
jgi:hypothetical protein